MICLASPAGQWRAAVRFRGQTLTAIAGSRAEARRALVRMMTAVLAAGGLHAHG